MGFMKSVGKAITGPIGQMAASFIPGVGPLVASGLGMAGSAFANSGQQGQQNTTGQWGQTGNTSQDYTGQQVSNQTGQTNFNRNESGEQRTIEDPMGKAFRESLVPQMARITAGAEEPVYGQAETAGFIGGLNDLTKDAMSNLRSNLAASGRMDSGSLALGASDIEMGRLGEVAKFQQQIPLMNRQYRDQARTQAMTLSQGLAGVNKLGQSMTGQSSGGETSAQQGTVDSTGRTVGTSAQSGTSQGQTTMQGPSFWKALAGRAGGLLGDAMGGSQNPLAALFKQKTQPGGGTTMMPYGGNLGSSWKF